jgi:hypothetical protein
MASRFNSGLLVPAMLLACCLACSLTGCKGLFGNQGLPHDPMFLDKKPIEAKARYAPPIALAYSEPVPPTHPSAQPPALAGRPSLPPKSSPVPGTLTNRPRPEKADDKEP